MSHKKDYLIKPHRHNKRKSSILLTTEVIIIMDGILRVDFYDNKKNIYSVKNFIKMIL